MSCFGAYFVFVFATVCHWTLEKDGSVKSKLYYKHFCYSSATKAPQWLQKPTPFKNTDAYLTLLWGIDVFGLVAMCYTWPRHRLSTGHLPKAEPPPRPPLVGPCVKVITHFMLIKFGWIALFVRPRFPRPGIRLAVAWLWNKGSHFRGPKR